MVLYCPKCGKELADDANYCLYCGKPIRVTPRTGLVTAGGILAIICACVCCLMGLVFIFAATSGGYYPSHRPDPRPTYGLIAIFNLLAFALGLFSGIHALKRSRFGSTIFGAVIMNLAGIAIFLCLFFEPYGGWLVGLIFGAPIMALSTLSIIFISTRRNEFLLVIPAPKPPTLPPRPMHRLKSSSAIRCPNCGHVNPANFIYCGKCGAALKAEETEIY